MKLLKSLEIKIERLKGGLKMWQVSGKLETDLELVEKKLTEIACRYGSKDYIAAESSENWESINNDPKGNNHFSFYGSSSDYEVNEFMMLLKSIRVEHGLQKVEAFILNNSFGVSGTAFNVRKQLNNKEEEKC